MAKTRRSVRSPIVEEIVDKIRQCLERENMSQRDFAETIGVTHVTVGRLLNGKAGDPTVETVMRIGAYFDKSLQWVDVEEKRGPRTSPSAAGKRKRQRQRQPQS